MNDDKYILKLNCLILSSETELNIYETELVHEYIFVPTVVMWHQRLARSKDHCDGQRGIQWIPIKEILGTRVFL